MQFPNRLIVRLFLFVVLCTACTINEDDTLIDYSVDVVLEPTSTYKTENVIVLVIDGPRYSETWGDNQHQYIPRLSKGLSKYGVINTQFFNNGSTSTNAGHTAITTGIYQTIHNGGKELPQFPSLFQQWSKKNKKDSLSSWIITSKDKLAVLSNCSQADWHDKYRPSTNCGKGGAGLGNGYRTDFETMKVAFSILSEHHPNLVLLNLREPDTNGHQGNWNGYLRAIKNSDFYMEQLWEFLQNDSIYSERTTLFVTNDHGRHLDGIGSGFGSHGDKCLGCRHINLFAAGPDFKKNVVLDVQREQIDITSTIATLLDFDMTFSEGEIMTELFDE